VPQRALTLACFAQNFLAPTVPYFVLEMATHPPVHRNYIRGLMVCFGDLWLALRESRLDATNRGTSAKSHEGVELALGSVVMKACEDLGGLDLKPIF
jgi:hypothetical protein